MGKNNKTVTENVIKIKAGLASGKSQRTVAEEVGLSQSYVDKVSKGGGQEWLEAGKTEFIKQIVDKSFNNVDLAIEVEQKFLNQMRDKEELTAADSSVASQIGERNQKRGSVLSGENTNEKGGEKEIKVVSYADTIKDK